jgi:hypothetical protein
MDKPIFTLRCWAEPLESGSYQGRYEVVTGTEARLFACDQIRDTPEWAGHDAIQELLRRILG